MENSTCESNDQEEVMIYLSVNKKHIKIDHIGSMVGVLYLKSFNLYASMLWGI